ncbi:choice-of-anchor I family protein [uncultured Spongiibacter sp.]|uniref:choice-of-anchor I family protein n=1 Tax=uncultured Spongiibacter sp. TaxID=870896 RepID=UPI0025951454|nr:choice-of-anchor I family protein [uncultured Spongiibacter sp.]
MQFKLAPLALLLTGALTLSACGGDDGDRGPQGLPGQDGANGAPGDQGPQGPAGEDASASTISLSFLGRYETGQFDESAAEIVDFDPATQRAFVVNANSGQIDVLDASSPAAPTLINSLDVAADVAGAIAGLDAADLGAANSVAVNSGRVAVAIEADTKQDNGYVAFYSTDGTFVSAVEAGALPDMVTFTPDGAKVLAANEGEPNGDYSVDPEGSITIVDISGGIAGLSAANVTQLSLNSAPLIGDVRISAKSASQGQDLEPEYIVVSDDSQTAFVILQENNAVAEIDLTNDTVSRIVALGYKDFSIPGNELDASNRDDSVNIRNWPVFGVYMPDGADAYTVNGTTYLVTANEGDGREYLTDAVDKADCTAQGGFDFDDGDCFHYLDEVRIKDINDDFGATFGAGLLARLPANFEDDEQLGRLKVITDLGTSGACTSLATTGQPGADCTYEALYAYGARSFTIWNTNTMQPVFDSGNAFEVITANRYGLFGFNASNDDNEGDDRSDDKGPEPEAVEIGVIDGKTYAFIGLERVGGIMVYNISNPEAPAFVQYINERDFTIADAEADFEQVGDLGPEAIKFVSQADSPTSRPMLIVGNEVTGTTSFYDIEILR